MTAAPSAPSTAIRGLGFGALALWFVLALPGLRGDRLAPLSWGVLLVTTLVCVLRPNIPERALALLRQPPTRTFVLLCAGAAALFSFLMVSGPLHDRPNVIDANVYLFQARALSHGHFGMPIPEPRQLFGGRFLFAGDDGRLYGVFPPGFPLFLAPFVWIGAPMLAGPVVAALLVFAQYRLGRAFEGEDGAATRVAVVLSLPSVARVVETADLLSHAFVAVLGSLAIAFALEEREESKTWRLLLIGGAIGWALAARLLDGILFGAFAGALLVGRVPLRRAILPLLSLLPFLTFLAFAQKAATGSFAVPTQSIFFARSDWPTTCHRLGFGVDVGCAVEHADERYSFGPNGYTLDDAFRVVRERASGLGADLFGFAPLALIGFAGVRRRRDVYLAAAILAFTLGYGLFYYGNAPIYGARHLFPIAPLFWLLVARAIVEPIHPRVGRSLVVAVLATATISAVPRWLFNAARLKASTGRRIDLRGLIDRGELTRGVIVTGDEGSWIASFDPYRDSREQRILVRFDNSGLKDLRRMYPELPVHSVLEGDVHQLQPLAPMPPGLHLELERTWPSFIRPNGLAARTVGAKSCCSVEASGDRLLYFFVASPGASTTLSFTAPRAGRFALRVDGLVAPDYGTYSIRVDDHALPDWDGYAEAMAMKQGAPTAPIELAAGPHTITFTCTGKRAESRGMLGAFDVLVGNPEVAAH